MSFMDRCRATNSMMDSHCLSGQSQVARSLHSTYVAWFRSRVLLLLDCGLRSPCLQHATDEEDKVCVFLPEDCKQVRCFAVSGSLS